MDVVKIAPETAPDPATNPDPSHQDTNVSATTNLSWSAAAGATGYKMSLWYDDAGKALHYVCQNKDLVSYSPFDGTINFTAEKVPIYLYSFSFHEIPSTSDTYYNMIPWCWYDLEYDDGEDPDVNIRISRLSNRTIVTFWHYPTYAGGTSNSITAQVIIYKDGRIFIMHNDYESTYDQTTQDCVIGI